MPVASRGDCRRRGDGGVVRWRDVGKLDRCRSRCRFDKPALRFEKENKDEKSHARNSRKGAFFTGVHLGREGAVVVVGL